MELHQLERIACSHSRTRGAELFFDSSIYPKDTNAAQLFQKTSAWLSNIQEKYKVEHLKILNKALEDALARTIYGSNRIERAGLGWNFTKHLCQVIFIAVASPAWVYKDHDEGSKDRALESIIEFEGGPACEGKSRNQSLRARNEVIQHANACQHIIHRFVEKEEDLSEELIRNAHHILTRGVPLEDERRYGKFIDAEYGGLYRDVIVGAGTTCFAHPRAIPNLMVAFCRALKRDVETVMDVEHVDPFSLAAKYSMEFVQIHPFRDGNGRMCRIILNAILCRFAGGFCPIGEDEQDRKAYIDIKRREGEMMHGHGEYALFVLEKCHTRVREMKKKVKGKQEREQLESD